MGLVNRFRNYILDSDFEIRIGKNQIDVINYENIDEIEDNKIIIKHINGLFIIKGRNLAINKLFNDEVLISGEILNLEFR